MMTYLLYAVGHKYKQNTFNPQLTLEPSNTNAWWSDPGSVSGEQPGRAQPTLMVPAVTTSNSKYHFPRVTAYDLSARNTRNLSDGTRFESGIAAVERRHTLGIKHATKKG